MPWLRPWACWRLIMAKTGKHGEEEHLPPDDEEEPTEEAPAAADAPAGVRREGVPPAPTTDAPTPPQDLPKEPKEGSD